MGEQLTKDEILRDTQQADPYIDPITVPFCGN